MGRAPRFGLLLVLILVVYALVIAFGDSAVAGLARLALVGLVLVVAVGVRGPGAGTGRAGLVVTAVALAGGGLAVAAGHARLAVALTAGLVALLAVAAMVSVGRVLWRRPRADAQSVGGALAIYLLLALAFAAAHQLLAAALAPPYVHGIERPGDSARFLYFSVITLATVGFGDITPASGAARAVTMLEALAGQLYLVAVVGTVVGNWRRPRDRGGGATTSGG